MTRWWLPVLCGVLQLVSVSVGPSEPAPPPWASAVGTLAALGAGLALLARRRAPMLVLAAATAGQVLQVLVDPPVFPAATTVAVLALTRRAFPTSRATVAALAGSVLAVAGSVAAAGYPSLAAPYALLLVLALLAGLATSARASHRAAERRELVLAERLRIARDLHDTVGHGLGAITVQAGAGRLALAAGAADEATRALLAIEEAGRGVLSDVRWMVALLRAEAERPGLRDIAALVDTARRSGLDITLTEDGDPDAASAAVGEVAYRLVQEAITNVLRHSAARTATIAIRVGTHVEVDVTDTGGPAPLPEGGGGGHGLVGMRERAASVGGQVDAGSGPDGAWSVRARLPAAAP